MKRAKAFLAVLSAIILLAQCFTVFADGGSAEDFVTRCYRMILNREPDEAGYSLWVGKLSSGKASASDAFAGFFSSMEFEGRMLSNEDFVALMYRAAFDRAPDEGGNAMWLERLESGVSRGEVAKQFSSSREFSSRYSGIASSADVSGIDTGISASSHTNDTSRAEAFVSRCYLSILGREPDESGLRGWTMRLASGSVSAADVVAGIIDSTEFKASYHTNDELVVILYKAMLGRAPDAAGMEIWLNALNSGLTAQQVVYQICGSAEFKNICSGFGIDPGKASYATNQSGSGVAGVAGSNADMSKIRAFVVRCYKLVLGRDAEAAGLEYWASRLASGEKSASEIIYGFFTSNEFMNQDHDDAEVVELLYKTMLDRPSEAAGKSYWLNRIYNGDSYAAVINGFCTSKEFTNLCNTYGIKPGSVEVPSGKQANIKKIRAFVTRCYRLILSREPDQGGLDYWVNLLAEGKKTAAEIIDGFFSSREFQLRNYSIAEKIEILYLAMLDRQSDAAGKAYWLNQARSGMSISAIINGFCTSTEFKRLCNQYGITPGSIDLSKVKYGWQTVNGARYYVDSTGSMMIGFRNVEGEWYLFDSNGVMLTGWRQVEGKQRYFGSDGIMARDWTKIGGVWYYFNEDGIQERQGPAIGSNTGVNLTDMKDVNKDFVAWMKIPGTNVNYPVVRSDNVEYYLDHDFYGNYGKDGALFSLGKCNWRTPSKNIVIYGHHVEGSGDRMFKALLHYKDYAYYQQHPVIYLDSMYRSGRYRIFAVFDMTEGDIDPSKTSFGSDQEFMNLISYAKRVSKYETGVTPNKNDTIITLVTCDRYFKLGIGRLIVMAVRE